MNINDTISFGHIEGSWLLYEAAEILGNKSILNKVANFSIKMVEKTLSEGIDKKNGGLFDEKENGIFCINKSWWPQAEAVIGFFNAYQLTNDEKYLDFSLNVWDFIKKFIIDTKYGEWYELVSAEGVPDLNKPKVTDWKCPYHNSRMCFEMIERINNVKTIK